MSELIKTIPPFLVAAQLNEVDILKTSNLDGFYPEYIANRSPIVVVDFLVYPIAFLGRQPIH